MINNVTLLEKCFTIELKICKFCYFYNMQIMHTIKSQDKKENNVKSWNNWFWS